MTGGRKRYSIIQLNDWTERGWGVVDEDGALLDLNGLSFKLTKEEARTIADRKNLESSENGVKDDA